MWLAEPGRFDYASGTDLAAGIGGDTEKIQAEVVCRLRPGIDPDLIKLAVADVREKRRPRW